MTFDEWWKTRYDCCCDCKDSCAADCVKCKAKRAWQAAQPKWTYCKDGKNPEQNQRVNVIIKPEIKKNPLYVDTVVYRNGNYINERMCHFEEVIAWMPLPNAPAEINSGFNKQGANI